MKSLKEVLALQAPQYSHFNILIVNGGIVMKRYSEVRYSPYLRMRCRTRRGGSIRSYPQFRSFILLLRFIVTLVCFVVALNGMTDHFREAVQNICEYKASQLVNEYIDRGVLETTSLYPQKSFVVVSRNSEGQVTSVETDAIEVNRFAAILSDKILKEIKAREHERIKAPAGALTGNDLLSSLGFSVAYRIIPAGKVTVSPNSAFDDSGINQTIHRLQMEVEVHVKILFPLMKKEETVKRTVILSETVIIGDVPGVLFSKGD